MNAMQTEEVRKILSYGKIFFIHKVIF